MKHRLIVLLMLSLLSGCSSVKPRPEHLTQEQEISQLTNKEINDLIQLYKQCDKALESCKRSEKKLETNVNENGPKWYDHILPAVIGLLFGLAIRH